MIGIGLFVTCGTESACLMHLNKEDKDSREERDEKFCTIPIEGAVALFVSKHSIQNNSIFDFSIDRLRFLCLPSTIAPHVSNFFKSSEDEVNPLLGTFGRSHSEIVKQKTMDGSAGKLSRYDSIKNFKYQKEIDLFSLVFVLNLPKTSPVEQYVLMLKELMTAFITEQHACGYLDKEVNKLLSLRKSHKDEEKYLNEKEYREKALSISSLAQEISTFFSYAVSKKPFVMTINNRTIFCSPRDIQAVMSKIDKGHTILMLTEEPEDLSSFHPPFNLAIVDEISPYRPLSAVLQSLNFDYTIEEILATAAGLVAAKIAKIISPITEQQYYVVSGINSDIETDFPHFEELFGIPLPIILGFFQHPTNAAGLLQDCVSDKGMVFSLSIIEWLLKNNYIQEAIL